MAWPVRRNTTSSLFVVFVALLVLLFACVVAILRGWPPQSLSRQAVATLRRQVALDTLTGVEEERRTPCIRHARRLLRRAGQGSAALLYAEGGRWVVCVGTKLSVVAVDDGGGVTVEYCGENPPLFRRQQPPAAEEEEETCPANLVEVPGSCIPITCIAVDFPIHRFATLEAAAAALHQGPMDDNGTKHVIVGGSRHHPVYYVVPVCASAMPTQDCTVAADCRARVWMQKN